MHVIGTNAVLGLSVTVVYLQLNVLMLTRVR